MTVDSIYKLCLFAVAKNQNGNLTPDDFSKIINVSQREYMANLLGSVPIARVQLGINAVVRQRLLPTIEEATLTVDNTTGIAPYPTGFLQADAMWTSADKRIIDVEQDKLYSFLESVIDPVATNPIFLFKKTGFQFYPITIGTAKISYVKNPADIVWGFSLDGNGRAVYDAASSTQCVFGDLAIMEIIARALNLVGISLQVGTVQQYAQQIKLQGQ